MLVSTLALLFWGVVFGLLYRMLSYFRGIPEIGSLLAGKLLALALLSFLGILMLSNVISALSTFFLARDLDMLVGSPVDWLKLYTARLAETGIISSWMVAAMAVPIFTAYGVVYDGGWFYPVIVIVAMIPFLAIPAVIGSALTLVLVNVFPARRTREILSFIAIMAAAGLVLLLRLLRPEQLVKPEGFRSLVEFIALLRAPTSPWLPSEWAQSAVMGWLQGEPSLLPFYMLWSTAAAFVVLGALLHRRLYPSGFSRAQEGAQRWMRSRGYDSFVARCLRPLGPLRRELVLKEVRLFFRDTTQWSQLILLAVLVVVYVFNIRYLPLSRSGVNFFLANVIPFVNLVIAGFVLASVAARFIFPGVSLEGRTLWLLRSSPMQMRDMLWAKFWVGTLPLLGLAVSIVFVTNVLLDVTPFMMTVSIFTITLMTFGIAGLAMGFGTYFPRYETENAAQIPTSFGGLVFMMSSVALIGGVIVLEARPVYSYLYARSMRQPVDGGADLVLGFGLAGVLCLAATFVPLRLAERRLVAGED